ncbi:MAG: ATP-binding protein [Roseiflexaceae bacterium]
MKRPRLYLILVLAFSLVIISVVAGMITFLGLTFAGQVPNNSIRDSLSEAAPSYATILADFYEANGESWNGVEERLAVAPFAGPTTFYRFTVLDLSGKRIADSDPQALPVPGGEDGRRPGPPSVRSDIMVNGQRIAVLVVRTDFDPRSGFGGRENFRREPTFFSNVWRSFVVAALVIGTVLFGLAVLFARRLNQPLRGLIMASESLAAGKLDTRVPGANVRELDELANAFNRMADSLASADMQRRQMTADIAHELRTPLSIMRGRLEGLQDGVYQATSDQIDALLKETSLLERLVDDLRLLALAEAGQLPLYRDACDPIELIDAMASSFGKQAAQQGVTLVVDTPDDLPTIDADPQRLMQVLGNLIGNALRHTPEGGQITLQAQLNRTDPTMVDLLVRDTGSGIAAEDLPKVFDRFWRADRSRTRGSGGAGLGLAIVKQIAVAHGGSVGVESTIGEGTTFRVTIPTQAPQPLASDPDR